MDLSFGSILTVQFPIASARNKTGLVITVLLSNPVDSWIIWVLIQTVNLQNVQVRGLDYSGKISVVSLWWWTDFFLFFGLSFYSGCRLLNVLTLSRDLSSKSPLGRPNISFPVPTWKLKIQTSRLLEWIVSYWGEPQN